MSRYSRPYEACLDLCANLEQPGCLPLPQIHDWSQQETTEPQSRIEEVLARWPLTGQKILHVGVGNSGLAARFSRVADHIDGLTLSENEKSKADSLGLTNYHVYVLNKFSRALAATLSKRYDLIVDDYIVSFACCKYHVYLMLDNYAAALVPQGRILTDQVSVHHVVGGGDPCWKLTYDDLALLAGKFSLAAERITDMVISLRKTF